MVAPAAHDVIVDHARRLHVRVTDSGTHELEPAPLEVLAHRSRRLGLGRQIVHRRVAVYHGFPVDELPDVVAEATHRVTHLEKGLGIGYGCVHLRPVTDQARVDEKHLDLGLVVSGNLLRIEPIECVPVVASLVEHGRPRQSRLDALEHEELELPTVVSKWHSPFGVVILTHELGGKRPTAAHDVLRATAVWGHERDLVAIGKRILESSSLAVHEQHIDESLGSTDHVNEVEHARGVVELERRSISLRIRWQELAHLTEAHGADLHGARIVLATPPTIPITRKRRPKRSGVLKENQVLLDGPTSRWDTHEASVFGPAAVVILDVGETQELGKDEPAVTRALADTAIGHYVLVGRDALGLVELLELIGRLEGAGLVDRLGPGDVRGPRYVPRNLGLLLG